MKQISTFLLTLGLATCGTAFAATPVTGVSAARETKAQSLAALNGSRTVLYQKQMAPGVVKRVVADSKGRVFNDIVKGNRISRGPLSINKPMRAPAGASFYEGFESHAGQLDWLPEGWTEINTEANIPTQEMCLHNINNTWAASDTGDGYWTAITTDGVKECWIHFSYDWQYKNDNGETIKGDMAPQDEWLITPQIHVQDSHDLFFLGQIDLGAVYNYDWNTSKYNRNVIEYDIEVLVSTDNGDNWTSLWKASNDVCSKMSDNDMYSVMGELNYNTYRVGLQPYYGKDVKIAFRYINVCDGFSGNSASVDAVTVAAAAAEAYYELPTGTLLAGISDGLHANTESFALMPAWTPITWNAGSNNYTESNSWAFYDDATGGMSDIQNGNTGVFQYPYSEGMAIPYPELTASNAQTSSVFSYDANDANKGGILFGGKMPMLVDETVYLGNYDYQHKHLVAPYLSNNAYCFGTSPEGTWGSGLTQTAIGNLFYAPAAPLTIDDVMLTLGEFDADDDAVITLEIFEVNNEGQVAATPAVTSSVNGRDIDGFGFYNVIFHLDTPYIMKGHTLMMVKGFDSDKVRTFAACAQSLHNAPAYNYAYMQFRNANGETTLYPASAALQDYASALYLSLNGTFHFLHLDEEIVDLDKETNDLIVTATASNGAENWYIVDGENRIPVTAQGAAYDWLTITPATATNRADGSYAVKFSADPSPTSRSKTVILANDGGQSRIRVRQPASQVGIESVTSDAKALTIDGNILSIDGAADDAILTIYAADGKMMISGRNRLNTSALGKGVYMVRCDNRTYKFVK